MAKGDKARHDAAAVVLRIEWAKEWGRIVACCERNGGTTSQAAVLYEVAHNRALAAQSWLTPNAYTMAVARGYREGFTNDVPGVRNG